MADRFRLLPSLMIALCLMFGLKAFSFVSGLSVIAGVSPAVAQDQGEADEAAAADSEMGMEGEAEEADMRAASEAIEPMALPKDEIADPTNLSRAEIEVLQSLAERRDELDAREQDIDMRLKLLEATELRVTERIAELKSIEAKIEAVLGQRDAEEDAQLDSLVKVYETMKPKDAARIFEALDSDILLRVAIRMKERSIASILAEMSSASAKDLTTRLATRLELPADVTGGEEG